MIELINFSKGYNKSDNSDFVVKDISFVAKPGQITGLLGLNGEGKTTIIKAICTRHYPSQGIVKISDDEGNFYFVDKNPEVVRSLIGYVPEISDLPLQQTVLEFLDFCANVHNLPENRKINSIKKVIKECELSEVLLKKIGTLSKGFRQRISLASALIHEPSNLILDEPMSGLDPAQIIQFRKLIKKVAETKTVLISTHLMQEVEALCSDIYILSKGKIVASGSETEIMKNTGTSSIEAAFLKATGTYSEGICE